MTHLQKHGAMPIRFRDGKEWLTAASDPCSHFDAVVLDHNMPHMNGLDALQQLVNMQMGELTSWCELEPQLSCPVVAWTGHTLRTEYEAAGATHFVPKTATSWKQILEAVARACKVPFAPIQSTAVLGESTRPRRLSHRRDQEHRAKLAVAHLLFAQHRQLPVLALAAQADPEMHSPVENRERKLSHRRKGSFYQGKTSDTAEEAAEKPMIGRTTFPPHCPASSKQAVSSQTLDNNRQRYVRRSYKCLTQPKLLTNGTEASALLPTPPQSPNLVCGPAQPERAPQETPMPPSCDEDESGDSDDELPPMGIIAHGSRNQGGVWASAQSQIGFYPKKPEHINQDCVILEGAHSGSYDFMMAVMDGHGPEGHHVAAFVQERLQQVGELLLDAQGGDFEAALIQAYEEVHKQVAASPTIDTRLSGTTCVSVWMHGDQLRIANLGDSRAVMGRQGIDGLLHAVDLTQDQTPFRLDERQRVKAQGARVMTSGEIHGEASYQSPAHWTADDPPRCYLERHNLPGTAFTRSLGDTIAQTIGVIATPEVRSQTLLQQDMFLIIASDGVWEFLTSQEAVDIVAQCSTPDEAAYKLIKASWELWHVEDVRADDISVIVAFLDHEAVLKSSSAMKAQKGTRLPSLPGR